MPSASTTSPARTYASSVDELEQIPFLPDTPQTLDTAVQREQRRAARPASETVAPGRYLGLYGKYVALFVGAGLISGSIVHYPLDKTRYVIIGAIGAVLFALASTFGDARAKTNGLPSLLKFITASLVLALGIGMISGGIQHFSDIPTRAATLIPLGGLLSVIAFAMRDGHRLSRRHVTPFAVAGSAALLWLALGLNQYAKGFDVPAAGADHHGAATTTDAATDAHATEETTATETESTAPAGQPAAEAETAATQAVPAEDHSAHGH